MAHVTKISFATAGRLIAAVSVASGTLFAQQMGTQHPGQHAHSTAAQHMSDRAFAEQAAQGGATEVALGKLAERKGSVSVVRDFGKRMAGDHSQAGEKLEAAASSDNIGITDQMSPKDQQLYRRLETLSGQAFDHAYARKMLTDHERDVAMFRQESKDGKDPAIKQFASNTLPILEHHLELARMMNDQLRSGATRGQQHGAAGISRQNGSAKSVSSEE